MRGFFSSMKSLVTGVVVDDHEEVTDLRGYWMRVQSFFQTVQKTNDESEIGKLRAKLPEIEISLGSMIDILSKERKEFVVSLEENAPDLPPCYDYLLRGASSSKTSSWEGASIPAGGDASQIPSTGDGRDIIVSVCQYAKHDQPVGSRAVMLDFLRRLFAEVDANRGSRSILHVSPEYVSIPLVNMLVKVGEALDPLGPPSGGSQDGGSRPRAGSATPSTGWNSLSKPNINTTSLQNDRVKFVALLEVLCEKVEQMPSAALHFFVAGNPGRSVSPPPPNRMTSSSPPATGAEDATLHFEEVIAGRLAQGRFFVLPHFLATYATNTTAVVGLSLTEREMCVERALRGFVSLAKTTSPVIQDLLIRQPQQPQQQTAAGSGGFAGKTIAAAVTSVLANYIVTMCKVPHDHEFPLLFNTSLHYMRFLDALTLLSPHLADSLQISALIQQHLLEQTFLPLLTSSVETVLVTAFAVLSAFLREAIVSEENVALVLDSLFTAGVSSKGTIVSCCSSSSYIGDPSAASNGLERNLFASVILPKIHDVADHVVASTLFFISGLIEKAPHRCLKFLFAIDGDRSPCIISKDYLASRNISVVSNGVLLINIDVNTLFPKRLSTQKGLCGSSTALFNDDILARLLRIDSNCAPHELVTHRVRLSAGSDATIPFVCGTTETTHDEKNFFFHPPAAKAPFAMFIAEKLSNFTQNSFAVNAALTSCVIASILLPDLRAFLSLLDPSAGPWTTALRSVKRDVDTILDRDETQTQSTGAAASSSTSLLGMFQRCAQRPFFDPDEQISDERFAAAMRASKTFVEACVCLEGFRHELMTAAGFVFVNHRMSELTQGGTP